MVKTKKIAVIGGDLRQAYLANSLASQENGHFIHGLFLGEEAKLSGKVSSTENCWSVLAECDVIIFPLPILDADGALNAPFSDSKVRLEDCLAYIPPHAVVLGGKVPKAVKALFWERGLEIEDYLEREEFAVSNAVLTAEGAVEIALRELPVSLMGANCVVTGYGRISKALTRLLVAFGAKVRVVARKWSDLAWIQANGCEAVHISQMKPCLPQADVLFNTVPAMILGEDKLKKLKRDCLVIDLASKPGGVDFDTAKSLGLSVIWALSLPGKTSPVSAGEITLNTIFNILNERGVL